MSVAYSRSVEYGEDHGCATARDAAAHVFEGGLRESHRHLGDMYAWSADNRYAAMVYEIDVINIGISRDGPCSLDDIHTKGSESLDR